MTIFVQQKRNSAIRWSVKEAFRADMVTLRWEGNTLLLKALLLDGKTACGACKQAVYLCFLGLCRNAQYLADGTFCGGPFWGLQSIKFLDASQFRLCLLYGNGMDGPGCRALQRVPSVFFCAKRTALHGFCPVEQSFLSIKSSYLPVSRKPTRRATVSVENQRGSCGFPLRPSREKAAQPSPQAWLSCKTKMQFLKLCAERSGAHLKS